MRRLAVSILLTLAVGYLPKLLSQYYIFVFGNKTEQVHYQTLGETCKNENICSKKYKIKKPTSNNRGVSLVVGSIYNASIWKCNQIEVFRTGDPSIAVANRQNYNNYYLIPLHYFKTCLSNEIQISTFHPKSQKKSGIREANFFIAPNQVAEKYKSAYEFVYKDYKVLNIGIMLSVFFLTILISILLGDNSSLKRLSLASLLAIGALSQSFIVEVIFPFKHIDSINRWMATLSYLLYTSLATDYLIEHLNKRTTSILPIVAFIAIYFVSGSRITAWIYYSYFISFLSFFLSLKFKSEKLFTFSILSILTSLNFSGYKGLPNSYIVPTYIAFAVFFDCFMAIQGFMKIGRLLRLKTESSRKKSQFQSRTNAHSAIIKIFQRLFAIQKLTLLRVEDNNLYLETYTFHKQSPTNNTLTKLPPVFAHVVTTGDQLIHKGVYDEKTVQIKGSSEKYKTSKENYFSVVPLKLGNEVLGGISMTDYPQWLCNSSLAQKSFLYSIDILKSIIVESILTTPRAETLKRNGMLQKKINIAGSENIHQLLLRCASTLSSEFGWRIAVFKEPEKDMRLPLIKCFRFNKYVEERFTHGKIYAKEENKQGPLALAVNNKVPVVVPSVQWMEDVFHKFTNEFIRLHGTSSMAMVPIIDIDHNKVVGVFWIEGVKDYEISSSDKELFRNIMSTMSDLIKVINANKKVNLSQEGLEKFIPKHLVSDYLDGKEVVENDNGYLLMFDIKGSTNLSRAISVESFHSEVDALKSNLEKKLEDEEGWKLRQFIWDGFDFTKSNDGSFELDYHLYEEEIGKLFKNWKSSLKSRHGNLPEIGALSYRICYSFGDISRGVVADGETVKWTLIGNAVAVASKVEQTVKKLEGTSFCDKSVFERRKDLWKYLTTSNQGLDVYVLSNVNELKKAS